MSANTGDLDAALMVVPPSGARWLALAMEAEREQLFLWAPVCLGAGIAAYFALPVEPQLILAFVPLVLALIIRSACTRGSMPATAMAALIIAGIGFADAKLRVEAVRAPVLAKTVHNADITGTVKLAEHKAPRGQRLTIANPTIAGIAPKNTPAVVRVRTMSSRSVAKPGDRIRLKATLSPPAKPALPGGFDYARTAWFDQVGGVGYAFAPPTIEASVDGGALMTRYRRGIEKFRQAIAVRIRAALPGETGEIALALITGERGGITVTTNNAFKNSGLFHILSISGLHMVIAAGAVFYSVRLLLAAVPFFALTLPIKKIAAAIGIFGALGYLAISGCEFATVRSALMILIIFGAVLIDRPALALRNVALGGIPDPGGLSRKSARRGLSNVLRRGHGADRFARASRPSPRAQFAPASGHACLQVLWRDHRVDVDRERRCGALRRLQLSSKPAVRGAGEHDRHSDLQHRRHAGGARCDGPDALRARSDRTETHGLGN